MKKNLLSALIAVIAVALALAFFAAGFFVRGWVDRELSVASPSANSAPSEADQSVSTPVAPSDAGASASTDIDVDDDPARGPEDALVTVVEFSDFQCPFCKRHFDQTLPLILDTYGDQVQYVFRDFPITSIHPQAAQAAEAAQCAFSQGKFWEYHDLLFENQGALDVDSLKGYADSLDLDRSAFDSCLDSGQYAQEVQNDFDEGRAYGVTGTPTLFINGRKVQGAQPYAAFQQIIEEELAKAGAD